MLSRPLGLISVTLCPQLPAAASFHPSAWALARGASPGCGPARDQSWQGSGKEASRLPPPASRGEQRGSRGFHVAGRAASWLLLPGGCLGPAHVPGVTVSVGVGAEAQLPSWLLGRECLQAAEGHGGLPSVDTKAPSTPQQTCFLGRSPAHHLPRTRPHLSGCWAPASWGTLRVAAGRPPGGCPVVGSHRSVGIPEMRTGGAGLWTGARGGSFSGPRWPRPGP